MSNHLRQFNGDKNTKQELLEFIHEHINTVALERMYKGEDVSHIKDAKELIDSSFDALEDVYGIKLEPKPHVNHSK